MLDLYVGTRRVLLGEGQRRLAAVAVSDGQADTAAIAEALSVTRRRASVRIWCSGSLCRAFLMPEVEGLRTHADRERAARAMLPGVLGWQADGCLLWLERRAKGSSVVVAMQAGVRDRLLNAVAAASPRSRTTSVRPWWQAALAHALQSNTANGANASIGIQDCDSLTVLAGSTEFEAVETFTPIVNGEVANATFARRCLQLAESPAKKARYTLTGGEEAAAVDELPLGGFVSLLADVAA